MAPISSVMDFRNRKDSESDEDELRYLNLNDTPRAGELYTPVRTNLDIDISPKGVYIRKKNIPLQCTCSSLHR